MKIRNQETLKIALGTVLLIGSQTAIADKAEEAVSYDAPVSISINLSYHTEMDMAEQDVFIEREPGSGEV